MRRLSTLTLALALAAALAWAGSGCGPSAEAQETARVLRAIDALRDAPADPISAREALVVDLERQEAKTEKAARARDACVKAYRLLNEGKSLQARVEKALATPGSSGLDTLRDLSAAEAKIKESTSAMPDCDSASSALRLGQGRGQ